MKMTLSVLLEAPLERVFEYLAEPAHRPEWQSSLHSVERLTSGPPRVGTRWRERPLGLAWVELEIVRLEPNRTWAERAELAFGTFTLTLCFTREGEGTRVDVDAELALRGAAKLLALGARLLLPAVFARDLRRAEHILRER